MQKIKAKTQKIDMSLELKVEFGRSISSPSRVPSLASPRSSLVGDVESWPAHSLSLSEDFNC